MIWLDSRARAERIVLAGRAVMACAGLFAVWLDPAEPARLQTLAYALLAGYALYALVLAAVLWRRATPGRRAMLAVDAVDLLVFAGLMALTSGPSSPFFVFLTFALLGGLLRRGWRGVLAIASACGVILLLLAVIDLVRPGPLGFEPHRAIIRAVYLAVATVMLVALGRHQAQVRDRLWRLAEPHALPAATGWPVKEALDHAAGVLGAPRALLVWGEPDEPVARLGLWAGGALREEPAPFGLPPGGVATGLERRGFVWLGEAGGTLVHRGGGRFESWRGPSLAPELAARLAARSAVSVPVPTDRLDARLWLLDDPGFTADDVLAAEAVAARVAALFEQAWLLRELRTAAAAEERVKIARDLHDGVLQALAGAALQLGALRPLVRGDPAEAERRIDRLREALATEQRELRAFVRAVAAPPPPDAGAGGGLRGELGGLMARLERQWDAELCWRLEPEDAALDARLAYDVWRLVAEAVANAVRHGDAGRVEIAVRVAGAEVAIEVADDGRGFPFSGRLDHAALARRGTGPRSIRERVAGRGGRLAVASGPEGARLEIVLPLRWRESA